MNDMHRAADIAFDNVDRMRKALYGIKDRATDEALTLEDAKRALADIEAACDAVLN